MYQQCFIKKKNIIKIIILNLFIFSFIYTQCPQSCLMCSNNNLTCTLCNTKNYLILINSTVGCLPCPQNCQKCISELSTQLCTSCSNSYYLSQQTGQCQKCQISNCIKCNIYQPNLCQQCIVGYYLQDSTSKCKNCNDSYIYSLTCIQNYILTCLQGYFTSNGQNCIKCTNDLMSSCKKCSSQTICSECFQGYFLLSNKCVRCNSFLNCKTCNNNSTCTSCQKGFRLNSQGKCQQCSMTNCTLCNMNDVCQQCNVDSYLDYQTRKCVTLLSTKIIYGCAKYYNNFNQTVSKYYNTSDILCTSCSTSHYLNFQLNNCQPCSLLCQKCTNYYRSSKCLSCNSSIADLIDSVNGICAPKIYSVSNNGQNEKILYINNKNHLSLYTRLGNSNKFIGEAIISPMTGKVIKCPGGTFTEKITISIGKSIGYQYMFMIKFLINKLVIQSYDINVMFNGINIKNITISPTSNTYLQHCNQLFILSSSFSFKTNSIILSNSSTIIQSSDNNITFSISSNITILLEIKQMVIKFKQCQASCLLCSEYQKCLKCKQSLQFIQGGKCLDTCQNGYLKDQSKMTCVSQCQKGMYPNMKSNQWKCHSCKVQCTACTSYQICQSCNQGYYLYNKTCLVTCPTKYYPSTLFNSYKCQKCLYPCSECISSTQCLSCQIGFYFSNNFTCSNQCPDGFYGDLSIMKCIQCVKPCEKCLGPLNCLNCKIQSNMSFINYQLNNTGKCLSSCPAGYFSQKESSNHSICLLCDFPCLQCSSISKKCTKCYDGYLYLSSNECLSVCLQGYFESKTFKECIKCIQPCKTCLNNEKQCLTCLEGYKINFQLKKCILLDQECDNNYYTQVSQLNLNNNNNTNTTNTSMLNTNLTVITKCLKCPNTCAKCEYNDKCTLCIEGYYLQNLFINSKLTSAKCLQKCNDGYYKSQLVSSYLSSNNLTINYTNNTCLKCSVNCFRCFGSSQYCLECIQNYHIQPFTSKCVLSCLETELFPKCQKCQYPCYSCINQVYQCILCETDYYLMPTNSANNISINTAYGQCFTQCKYGFYKYINQGFGYCKNCQSPCQNCQSSLICHKCSTILSNNITIPYFIQSKIINNTLYKTCVQKCSQLQYQDKQFFTCMKCISPCLKCKNLNYCISCQNGILNNGTCLNKFDGCPIGQYVNYISSTTQNITVSSLICQKCLSRCYQCSSLSLCTGCAEGYYLNESSCLTICPAGTTTLTSLRKCIPCEYPCLECSFSPNNCTKCHQISLYLTSSTSYSNAIQLNLKVVCPQYRKSGNYCITFYYYNGQCLTQCLATTYPKGQKCLPCQPYCLTCLDSITCTSCLKGSYLLQNTCYNINCPDEYYSSKQISQCIKCPYPCKLCYNQTSCITCLQGYFYKNKCLVKDGCPVGYYETSNQTLGKYCDQCNVNCAVCEYSKDNCVECFSTYYINGNCTQKCPDGYYSQSKLSKYIQNKTILFCQKCSFQSLTCSNQSFSLSCSFSYVLYENKCIKKCPLSTIQKSYNIAFNNIKNYQVFKCVKCESPCDQCILSQNLCEKCIEGYFLYEKKCLKQCPQSTYLNSLTKSCKECPFPCKKCKQNSSSSNISFNNTLYKSPQIICEQCLYGYFLLNQQMCVDSCNNNKFIDSEFEKCVDSCGNGYQIIKFDNQNVKYCSQKCQLPYLKGYKNQDLFLNQNSTNITSSNNNKKCVFECSQQNPQLINNFYVNSQYQCTLIEQNSSTQKDKIINFPNIKSHFYRNNKGIPSMYISFDQKILYTDNVKSLQDSIKIVYKMFDQTSMNTLNSNGSVVRMLEQLSIIKQNSIIDQMNINRLLQIQQQPAIQFKQQQLSFMITLQTKQYFIIELYPIIDIYSQSFISVSFKQNTNYYIIAQTSQLPLQQSQITVSLGQSIFQAYPYEYLNNRYNYIGQILIDFVLIIGVILFMFNRYSKIYNFLIFSQHLFMLVCLNIQYPPNLFSFLQGFKYAHFYQFGNLFISNLQSNKKYTNYQNQHFNRIQSIFNDNNFIIVIGHILCIYIAIILIVGLLFILVKYLPKFQNQYISLIIYKIQSKLKLIKWSHITDIFISTFMLIIAAFLFQTYDYSTDQTLQSIAIFLSYILLFILIAYLIYFSYKIYKLKLISLKQPQKFMKKQYLYRQQYAPFFQGINQVDNIYKNYLILAKIIIYGVFTGIFWNYPNFSISIYLLLQIIFIFIYIFKKPYSDEKQNYIFAISSIFYSLALVFIVIISQHSLTKTYQITQQIIKKSEKIKEQKYILGYFVIVFIMISLFLFFVDMIRSIMRGNNQRYKLQGEEDQYVKFNNISKYSPKSPNQPQIKNNEIPKKIRFQEKKQFIGYSINNFLAFNQNQSDEVKIY